MENAYTIPLINFIMHDAGGWVIADLIERERSNELLDTSEQKWLSSILSVEWLQERKHMQGIDDDLANKHNIIVSYLMKHTGDYLQYLSKKETTSDKEKQFRLEMLLVAKKFKRAQIQGSLQVERLEKNKMFNFELFYKEIVLETKKEQIQ